MKNSQAKNSFCGSENDNFSRKQADKKRNGKCDLYPSSTNSYCVHKSDSGKRINFKFENGVGVQLYT